MKGAEDFNGGGKQGGDDGGWDSLRVEREFRDMYPQNPDESSEDYDKRIAAAIKDDADRYEKFQKNSEDSYRTLEREVRDKYVEKQENETDEEYEKSIADLVRQRNLQEDNISRGDFSGETNINSKTGKKRTFTTFDLYPIKSGVDEEHRETPREYGDRLIRMNELTKQYLAGEEEKKEAADKERKQEAFDKFAEMIRKKIKSEENPDGVYTEEEAEAIIERARERFGIGNEGKGGKGEDEGTKGEGGGDEGDGGEGGKEEEGPLVAINANFEHDRKELAHDLAEQDLNAEVADAKGLKGLVKRIWKGNLFKKYYELKYTKEYLAGERVSFVNGEESTVDDLIEERSSAVIKRFTLGAVREQYVHDAAGEKLKEASTELTEGVRDAISKYAESRLKGGQNLEDLRREFGDEIGRLMAEARDRGENVDGKMINNYYDIAVQAFERANHGVAIEKVMEGFKAYNAESRDGVRTEVHRDACDKIINAIESSKVGRFVSPELIAIGASVATALTQTGVRAVAGTGAGIAFSSIYAGLRERNRVTEDRARMMRDVANGGTYDGIEGYKGKTSKYEAKLGGTLYLIEKAGGLVERINAAKESGNEDEVLQAIAEARVRIDYSDAEKKDLISYSSEDKRGEERLALDMAVIEAEASLSDEKKEVLKKMKETILETIDDDVSEKDKDFKKLKAVRAMKQAGKTLAIGATTFFASQEIMAAFDPTKVGLLEKLGVLKTQNAENAEETILTSVFTKPTIKTETQTIIRTDINDPAEIQKYEQEGFTRTEVQSSWVETKNDLVDVRPGESVNQMSVKYDGWANNGTTVSDGNELAAHIRNGSFVSTMHGESTMGGTVFNYEELAKAGSIKGYITIDGAKFELASTINDAGQITWGENGVFTTTTGELIKGLGDNGEKLYKYFEIAVDRGVDADGITHIVPLATDIGKNTFSGTISQVIETQIEHPAVYEFTKEITNTVVKNAETTFAGVTVPIAGRRGLGENRIKKVPEAEPEEKPEPGESEEKPEPGEGEAKPAEEDTKSEDEKKKEQDYEYARQRMIDTGYFPGDTAKKLLEKETYTDSDKSEYRAWFAGLDEEKKEKMRGILNNNKTSSKIFGKGIFEWWQQDGKINAA